MVQRMSAAAKTAGSVIAGIIVSLVAVFGGVGAITPGANAEDLSAKVVLYDGR